MTWQVGGNLTTGYTPPISPEIGGDVFPPSSTLFPSGWFSSQWGTPAVINFTQYVAPTGLAPQSAPPSPTVWNFTQTATPSGWLSGLFGAATIYNTAQGVAPGGIAPPPQTGPNSGREVPSPSIWFRTRYLSPSGLAPQAVPATHAITHEIQFVDLAGRSILPPTISAPRIEFRVRYIEPPFIFSLEVGTHVVARTQQVAPTGWSSSAVPDEHDLQINLQRLFPLTGITDPAAYGQATVRNQREIIRPLGWVDTEFNFPVVWNLTQYLFVQPYMGTNDPATQWPEYAPFVENRNRALQPRGWQSSRIGVLGHNIRNRAEAVAPEGFEATVWGRDTFIAHRIRTVYPQSWVSFYSTEYTVVYTNTQWLHPSGWTSAVFGRPDPVRNTNQTVRHIDSYLGPLVGEHTISFGRRTLAPFPIPTGRMGEPEIRPNPYPIAPRSIHDPRQVGGHFVEERFTIIRPSSTNVFSVPRVGEPIVANRNRTLRAWPLVSDEYGRPTIFNLKQSVEAGMGDLLQFGLTSISRRTRIIVPASIEVPEFTRLHRIRNLIPDPPGVQRVFPTGIYQFVFGDVAFNRQSILPLGFTGTSYGIPGFSLNEIRPQSIVDLFQVGTPSVSGPQYTYPRAIEPTSDAIEVNTVRHRVTPHTIYAPSGDQASDQSKRIHQERPLHTIDGLLFTEANPQVPKPTVSNQLRSIGPVPTHSGLGWSSRFGTPELTLRLQFVRPPSIRAFRSGLPVFLNVPQTISFEEYGGFLSEEIGGHRIAHVPVRRMPSPDGFVSSEFGTSSVELKNRAVFPVGISHRGNPQQGLTTPWGTAMVGTTRWFDFQGFDTAEFGTARVEFRIRTLPVQGWDSFADSQGDPAPKPQDRMRVMRVGPSGRQNIILFVSSIYRETPSGITPTSEFGTPAISFYVQHIGARGFRSYRNVRRERFGQPVVSTV